MKKIVDFLDSNTGQKDWSWWPLFPLYPYGVKKTIFKELVKDQIWSFEQLQGLYYVAVPVRLTVIKVPKGLMVINPLPPTQELVYSIKILEEKYGPVLSIVLPTASGLEHKFAMPALARSFPKADLWICPGQWSFPVSLPLSWLGFPNNRTRALIQDGVPFPELFEWISLGPIDIGLGRFQEIACFHKLTKSLIVTDALIGIEAEPPEIFNFNPTPLLFHARDRGDEPLKDTPQLRRKGWARLVLFASFLKPSKLSIPSLYKIFENAFKPELFNLKSHFGLYPFYWNDGWELSAKELIGKQKPLLQVAPVLKRLVFPRAKEELIRWLKKLTVIKIDRLISSHYSAPLSFSRRERYRLIKKISSENWLESSDDFGFLASLDKSLLDKGVIPLDPMSKFSDQNLRD